MDLKIDQEFKDLIPPLSAEETANLEQSLLTEGCRDAILTWNNFIIDGHNRFALCTKHNLPFRVEAREFDSRNDVCIWMIQNQFARRNLSNYVRGDLGLKLEGFFRQKAEENLKFGGRPKESEKGSPKLATLLIKKVDTREEVSKVSGISHGNIDKIKEIKSSTPTEVLSDLEKKLITGEISINQAHKFVRMINGNSGVARRVLVEFDRNPTISLENKTKDVLREIQKEERDRQIKEAEEKKRQEAERIRKEREERERLEAERLRKEREEKERAEKERLEQARLAREKAIKEREEQARIAREKYEKEQAEKERLRKERQGKSKK